MEQYNVLLTGVGGQGILLAGDILSRSAIMNGLDVKKAETHGMAQRGGSVVTHLRMGDKVRSAMVPVGGADLLVSFEILEALRYSHYLSPNGSIVYSTSRVDPLPVLRGLEEYPSAETIGGLRERFKDVMELDAPTLAMKAGHPLTQNVVMIGAASTRIPLPHDSLRSAVELTVKRAKDANLKAFDLGREAALALS